jgi:hypothetical protein
VAVGKRATTPYPLAAGIGTAPALSGYGDAMSGSPTAWPRGNLGGVGRTWLSASGRRGAHHHRSGSIPIRRTPFQLTQNSHAVVQSCGLNHK